MDIQTNFYEKSDKLRNSNNKSISSNERNSAKKKINLGMIDFDNLSELFSLDNFRFENKDLVQKGDYYHTYKSINRSNTNFYFIKKIFIKKLANHKISLEKILNEANIHMTLTHENIIKLNFYHETEDHLILIYDYIENLRTLESYLKTQPYSIDEFQNFNLFLQILCGLNYLHENKILHRNLSKKSILVDSSNNVYLSGFDHCVQMSVGNRKSFVGDFEYLAPEIINESPYNFGVDIWSVGVILYELVNESSPFNPKGNLNNREIFENILNCELLFKSEITSECTDLIKKMLSKDRNERIKLKDIFSHKWVTMNKKKSLKKIPERETISTHYNSNKSMKDFESKSVKKSFKSFNLNEVSSPFMDYRDEKEDDTLFDDVLSKLSKNKLKTRINPQNSKSKNLGKLNQFRNLSKKIEKSATHYLRTDQNDNYYSGLSDLREKMKRKITSDNFEYQNTINYLSNHNQIVEITEDTNKEKDFSRKELENSMSILNKVSKNKTFIEEDNKNTKKGFFDNLISIFKFECNGK